MDENITRSCAIINVYHISGNDEKYEVVRKCPFRSKVSDGTSSPTSSCSNTGWTENGPFDWCPAEKVFFRKK